jgi:pimeloyl-ACP methyl ester carboxylesterase
VTMAPPAEPGWVADGPADAPAIVFVHGAMMGRNVWRPQVDRLAARYRCTSVDLPGHGTRRLQPFTLEAAAEAVEAAIDAAGGRAVLVGLSLGGYVSMTVAGRSPARVRGLVIADCTREPAGWSAPMFVGYGWFLRIVPASIVRRVALTWFRLRYGRRVAAQITAGEHFSPGGSQAVRHIVGRGFRARLAAYGGPVLAVNGQWDLPFRVGAARFTRGIPNLRLLTLRGAGHLANVDRPDAFSHLVDEFAASLGA